MLLSVEIPLHIPSVSNLREHWSTKAKRTKAQRQATKLGLIVGSSPGLTTPGRLLAGCATAALQRVPLTVTLTRIGRKLDSDNLASAFKAVRDQVAAELGIDDGSDAVTWEYRQEKGKAGIRIEIAKRDACTCDGLTKTWRPEDRAALCGHLPQCQRHHENFEAKQ